MEYGIWNMEYGIWNMEYGKLKFVTLQLSNNLTFQQSDYTDKRINK